MTPNREIQSAERVAAMIQSVGELGRGLDILDRELRAGQFTAARDTVTDLRVVLGVLDHVMVKVIQDAVQPHPACVLADDGVTCTRTEPAHRARWHT